MPIKPLAVGLGCLFVGISAISQAVTVRMYVQNIHEPYVCEGQDKANAPALQERFKQFIAENNKNPDTKFDFILTQEFHSSCENFFKAIENMGYASVASYGDSTLFYKKSDWNLNKSSVDNKNITYNIPDTWGQKGERNFVYGSFLNQRNPKVDLCVGTTHLCIDYPGSLGCLNVPISTICSGAVGGGYGCKDAKNNCSRTACGKPMGIATAHSRDLSVMQKDLQSISCSNWIIAGDLNATSEKPALKSTIKGMGATNVNELDGQAYDMAFYKLAVPTMKYTKVDLYTSAGARFSDHNGFILQFDLGTNASQPQ